jgi:hypothetical protein
MYTSFFRALVLAIRLVASDRFTTKSTYSPAELKWKDEHPIDNTLPLDELPILLMGLNVGPKDDDDDDEGVAGGHGGP